MLEKNVKNRIAMIKMLEERSPKFLSMQIGRSAFTKKEIQCRHMRRLIKTVFYDFFSFTILDNENVAMAACSLRFFPIRASLEVTEEERNEETKIKEEKVSEGLEGVGSMKEKTKHEIF